MSPKLLSNIVNLIRHQQRNLTAYSSLIKTATVRPNLRAYYELAVISPGRFEIPKKPFDLEIEYSDSSPNEKKSQTVVAVHGINGSHRHFSELVTDFHDNKQLDVRIVAVSLPDFSHTRTTKYFWHTTPERVNFLRQFLTDLNIKTVDCFITHSFAIHPFVGLWDDPEDITIRSVCMYAPMPFWSETFMNDEKIKNLFRFRNNLWYKFLDWRKVHKNQALQFNNVDEMLLFYSSMFDNMIGGFENRLRRVVKNTNTPMSVVYGTKEDLIRKPDREKFMTIIGVRNDEIVSLDSNIHTEKDIVHHNRRVHAYFIENADHFVHIQQHKFAKQILLNLLKSIRN